LPAHVPAAFQPGFSIGPLGHNRNAPTLLIIEKTRSYITRKPVGKGIENNYGIESVTFNFSGVCITEAFYETKA